MQLLLCLQIWFGCAIDDIMPSLVLLLWAALSYIKCSFAQSCLVLGFAHFMLQYCQAYYKCHEIPCAFALSSYSSPCVSLIPSWPPLFLYVEETCSKKLDTFAQFIMKLWPCHSFQTAYSHKEFGFCPV